jgi:hypothetical protein
VRWVLRGPQVRLARQELLALLGPRGPRGLLARQALLVRLGPLDQLARLVQLARLGPLERWARQVKRVILETSVLPATLVPLEMLVLRALQERLARMVSMAILGQLVLLERLVQQERSPITSSTVAIPIPLLRMAPRSMLVARGALA